MAKAEKILNEQPDIQLTLTHDEASTLADILGGVGGDMHYSRRKYASNISVALAGVNHFSDWLEVTDMRTDGSIYFNERDDLRG